VEALALASHLYTIASGDVGTHLKFYFYAGDADNGAAFHLFEMVLDKSNGNLSTTVKTDAPAALQNVLQFFALAFKSLPAIQ
jgi:hypothetical protein